MKARMTPTRKLMRLMIGSAWTPASCMIARRSRRRNRARPRSNRPNARVTSPRKRMTSTLACDIALRRLADPREDVVAWWRRGARPHAPAPPWPAAAAAARPAAGARVGLETGLGDPLLEPDQEGQKPAVPAGQLLGVEHHPPHGAARRELVVDHRCGRQPILQAPAAGKAEADGAIGRRIDPRPATVPHPPTVVRALPSRGMLGGQAPLRKHLRNQNAHDGAGAAMGISPDRPAAPRCSGSRRPRRRGR